MRMMHTTEDHSEGPGSSTVKLDDPAATRVEPDDAPASSVQLDDLSSDNDRLRDEIARIRVQRRRVHELRRRQEELVAAVHLDRNASLVRQEQELLDYVSLMRRKALVDAQLQQSQTWHALFDSFPIATMGAYGTINGLRLGSEAPVLETGNVDSMVAAASSSASHPPSSSDASFDPRPMRRDSGPLPSHGMNPSSSSPASTPSRVPWSEVNAALGQVALLLVVMKDRPHSGIIYRHDIQPMGSTSKIVAHRGGAGPGGAQAAVSATGGRGWTYNLHSDDSFQFFGKRNFNAALTCLLECVADAARCVQDRDRTVSLPHEMAVATTTTTSSEATVGGLSITYSPTPEWTRACKYLLTNLKHLMTYKVLSLNFYRPKNGVGKDQGPPRSEDNPKNL